MIEHGIDLAAGAGGLLPLPVTQGKTKAYIELIEPRPLSSAQTKISEKR